MAGLGDGTTGPAAGHLRASHADRAHVIDILKAAFVQGRLTKDELDLRAGQTLASRTYADLAAITADLPYELIRAELPRTPAPAQLPPPVNKPLMWGSVVLIVAAIAAMVGAFPADSLTMLASGVLALLIATPVAGTLLLDSRRDKRSRGQPPPRDGQALGGQRGRIDPHDPAGPDAALAASAETAAPPARRAPVSGRPAGLRSASA